MTDEFSYLVLFILFDTRYLTFLYQRLLAQLKKESIASPSIQSEVDFSVKMVYVERCSGAKIWADWTKQIVIISWMNSFVCLFEVLRLP